MANTISEKIKELLRKEKKTQKEISDYLGFSIMGFNRMLKADDYKFSTLLKIADFFNVSIDYFTSGAKTSTKSKEVEKLELEIKSLKERLNDKTTIVNYYALAFDSILENMEKYTELVSYEILNTKLENYKNIDLIDKIEKSPAYQKLKLKISILKQIEKNNTKHESL